MRVIHHIREAARYSRVPVTTYGFLTASWIHCPLLIFPWLSESTWVLNRAIY